MYVFVSLVSDSCGLVSSKGLFHKGMLPHFYSCGLSTATIEYSSLSVCLSVCLGVCLSVCCVHDNSKNDGSVDLKLEHTVVYENSSDEFDIGHCPIKVKVTA